MADARHGMPDRLRSPDTAQHRAGRVPARPLPAECVVPELQKKLGLLVRYGYFESFEAIAAALGRKPKTVRRWAHGDGTRDAGRIPADSHERVIRLLTGCLVPDVPEHRALEIVLGPASLMAEQLGAGVPRSIRDFVAAEGDAGACRLFAAEEGEIGLIETDQERPRARFRVELDGWFRIVVGKDLRRRNIVALQLTSSTSGFVPHALEPATGHVLLPGLKEDGGLAYMRERRDNGVSRFAVIGIGRPWPADIPADGTRPLSEALLDRLGHVYGQQPPEEREIHVATVDIRKPG